MRFGFLDADGRITEAHNDDTVSDLPEGAVLILDEEWDNRFDLRLVDGALIDDPVPAPTPSSDELEAAKIKAAETAVQKMLDDAAKADGYDGILSAASYAALPVGEPFQAEGAAFLLWRAKSWARCYEILAAVKAGTRDEPTIPELLAEMPALVLP